MPSPRDVCEAEGAKAYRAGEPREANPYLPHPDRDHEYWSRGWDAAQAKDSASSVKD